MQREKGHNVQMDIVFQNGDHVGGEMLRYYVGVGMVEGFRSSRGTIGRLPCAVTLN